MKPDILTIKKKLFKKKNKNPYVVKFGAVYSPDNTVTIKPTIDADDKKHDSRKDSEK